MQPMIGTDDILAGLEELLDAKTIQKKDIADAIGIVPQRVAQLFTGRRKLKLDEAQRLVEAFGLEESPADVVSSIVTTPILMMGVRHVLQRLCPAVVPEMNDIEDTAKDLGAFFRYAADPQIRDNIEMAKAFFLAHRAMIEEAPQAAS